MTRLEFYELSEGDVILDEKGRRRLVHSNHGDFITVSEVITCFDAENLKLVVRDRRKKEDEKVGKG